ncbi:hypothetical protein M569_04720, partial [Genlisea aurea]
ISNVIDKESEFKPSFDEYLKALESVKIDRATVHTGRIKEIEDGRGNDGVLPAPKYRADGVSSNGNAFDRVHSREDSLDDQTATGDAKNKRIRMIKNVGRMRNDDNGSSFLHSERAAFKSLDSEGNSIGGTRVTRAGKEDRIQKLAMCLNGAPINIPEWQFSKIIRSAQIKYTDYSIMRLVQILGMLGNWKRVLQVIEWMQSQERFKSDKIRYVYTAALNALGKARRPVEALNLFHAMLDQMSSYPDIVVYRSIAVTLGQAGYMKELFDVIDTLRAPPKKKFKNPYIESWDPRMEPDLTVYNAVLNACVQRKSWEGAFWVLQQLSRKGERPSCTTYGLVMEVMFACGKYNLVHEFFKKVEKSYRPNALIYRVLVNTLWKEGKTDEAIMAVDEMEKRGIVGNAGIYYDLARCLCSAGRCDEALKQVSKICRVANRPLVVTYTGLMQACLDAGYVVSGAYIFNHMQKFCSPNLVTHNIMLRGFLDHGRYQEAKTLFMKMLNSSKEEDCEGRVTPDTYSFNTMLEACAVEKEWDDLEHLYVEMLKCGHHFNAKRHLQHVLDAHRAGKEEMLEMTWKNLLENKRFPPVTLVTEMLCKKLERCGPCEAVMWFSNSPCADSNQAFSKKLWLKLMRDNDHVFNVATLNELIRCGTALVPFSGKLTVRNLVESCRHIL